MEAFDVIRRELLLKPVSFSPRALERQKRLTEPLQIRQFLASCTDEGSFGTDICIGSLIQGGKETVEKSLHGPRSTSSCDLLPYQRGSLTSGPTQKRLSSSGMPVAPATCSMSWV